MGRGRELQTLRTRSRGYRLPEPLARLRAPPAVKAGTGCGFGTKPPYAEDFHAGECRFGSAWAGYGARR